MLFCTPASHCYPTQPTWILILIFNFLVSSFRIPNVPLPLRDPPLSFSLFSVLSLFVFFTGKSLSPAAGSPSFDGIAAGFRRKISLSLSPSLRNPSLAKKSLWTESLCQICPELDGHALSHRILTETLSLDGYCRSSPKISLWTESLYARSRRKQFLSPDLSRRRYF